MNVITRRAGPADLDVLTPLFDGYRQFYGHPTDQDRARAFLRERLARDEAIVFLAEAEGRTVGFTLLYPTFSSTATGPILVLNDIYVRPDQRRLGAGRALLEAAMDYGRAAGCVRLTLYTEHGNITAQAAYEALGWQESTAFKTYNYVL